jgi:type I restriction enzyme S subunit
MSFKLSIGRTAVLGLDAYHNEAIISITPNEGVERDFLRFYLPAINYSQVQDRAIKGNTLNKAKIDALPIALPPPGEQRVIASVLAKIQRAVEVEDRRIAALKELKAATMAKVFREGLRGEALKATEIGELPGSWDVVELGSVLLGAQYGLSVRGQRSGRVPILRMNCQEDGLVVFRDLQYVDLDDAMLEAFSVDDGDLLFNRTNSFELVGRTALFQGHREAVFASYLIRLKVRREAMLPQFLNYYLNLGTTQRTLKAFATRGVSQSNISASKVKTLLVPKPALPEQLEIAGLCDTIAASIQRCAQRRVSLADLFSAALHQLMAGQLRVTPLLDQEEAPDA